MKKCLAVVLLVAMISSCSIIFDDVPESYKDDTVVLLNREINTVQEAIGFADNRVYEWGVEAQKLSMVSVVFWGEQIEKQKGKIECQYSVDDGKNNYIAETTVTIDMGTGTITSIYAWYDVRTKSRRLHSGYLENWDNIKELDFSKWEVTIDDAFDIVYETIGDDAFSRFDNPKIILNCFADKWIFYVVKENENTSSGAKNILTINPITEKVTEIKGFGKDTGL